MLAIFEHSEIRRLLDLVEPMSLQLQIVDVTLPRPLGRYAVQRFQVIPN